MQDDTNQDQPQTEETPQSAEEVKIESQPSEQEAVIEAEVVEEKVTPEEAVELANKGVVDSSELKDAIEEAPAQQTEVEVPEAIAPVEETAPATENTPAPKIWDLEEASKKPEETEEPKPEEQPQEIDETKPYTVRTEETGDKVYCVREGKRYWIRNPDTLTKMGFNLGGEKRVAFSELLAWPEGEPIDLTIPGAVYPWDKPEADQPADVSKEPYKVWS